MFVFLFLPDVILLAFLITANAFETVLESTSISFVILFATKGSTADEIDLYNSISYLFKYYI